MVEDSYVMWLFATNTWFKLSWLANSASHSQQLFTHRYKQNV